MDALADGDAGLTFLQLVDSAFPTGAFAHSGGLEAAVQLGELSADDLDGWCRRLLDQLAASQLPFVVAAARGDDDLAVLDRHCDALTLNHVARRAATTQGQALLHAAAAIDPAAARLRARVRSERLPGHLAPMTGAVAQALGLGAEHAALWFATTQVRGWLSAAVRLSLIGPLAAQRMQRDLHPALRAALAAPRDWRDATTIDPLPDLCQGQHDRLTGRLFNT